MANDKINLLEMNSRMEQMVEAFMNEEPVSFAGAVAKRISQECGVDGQAVVEEFYAGALEFQSEYRAQQEGKTLYDRCEERDIKAGCDRAQRMANRNQDIIRAHMLLQAMMGEEPDGEAEEALKMNLEHADLTEEEQKELLNTLNEKAANLGAAHALDALYREQAEAKTEAKPEVKAEVKAEDKLDAKPEAKAEAKTKAKTGNKWMLSVSRAAAMYVETAKLSEAAKAENAENAEAADAPAQQIDAKTLGFLSAAMAEAQEAVLRERQAAPQPGAEYDGELEAAERALEAAKQAAGEKQSELEKQLMELGDGAPEESTLQTVLTGIGGVVAGVLATNAVFNKVLGGMTVFVTALEGAGGVEAILGLMGAILSGYGILVIVAVVAIAVGAGVFLGSNALIDKIRASTPEAKAKMAEAAQMKAELEAALEKAKQEGKLDIEEAEKAVQELLEKKNQAQSAPLLKAKEEARAALALSRVVIKERIVSPCRRAMQAAKEKLSAGAKKIGSMLGIGKKEREMN